MLKNNGLEEGGMDLVLTSQVGSLYRISMCCFDMHYFLQCLKIFIRYIPLIT